MDMSKATQSNQTIRFLPRSGDGQLYTVLNVPAETPPTKVVLVCPPAFEEHGRAYPILREFARWSCARGIAVLRFDCFGTGESSGAADQFSFGTAAADVSCLISWLGQTFPNTPVVPLGVRLGCRFMLDALATPNAHEGIHVATPVLWDPVLDARAHILSELRATIAGAMIVYQASVASREDIVRETMTQGFCERGGFKLNQIEGYPVTPQLLREAGVGNSDSWTSSSPACAIVTVAGGDGERQRDHLRSMLPQMEFHSVQGAQYWSQPPLYSQKREGLFRITQERIEACK